MQIGTFIKNRRKELGITQITLSRYLGVSQSLLSKIEANSLEISLTCFSRAAHKLNLDMHDIYILLKLLGEEK